MLNPLSHARSWRGMMRRTTGRRIVGVLGSDGAIFVRFNKGKLADRIFVAAPDSEGVAALRAFLSQDRKARVSLLVDVLEQHYREAHLPRLNPWDRRQVLGRKLRQTFDTGTVSTAVQVSRRALSTDTEGQGQNTLLLIGLPVDRELRAWSEAVLAARNPVEGMGLLPVEAHRLVRAVATTGAAHAVWEVLILRHRASGYRQIVFYNGDLVFTRLTPNMEAETPLEEEVDTVESEFRSTMSYLRRLSFTDADEIEVTLVVPSDIGENLSARRMRVREVSTLTPAKFAERLGLSGERYGDDNFCDTVIAEWFARQRWSQLSLEPPTVRRARIISFAPKPIGAVAAATLVAGTIYNGTLFLRLQDRTAALREAAAEHQRRQRQLGAMRDKLAAKNIDVEKFALSVRARSAMASASPLYARSVKGLANALPENMIVTRLQLGRTGTGSGQTALVVRARNAIGDDPATPQENLSVMGAAAGTIKATVRLLNPPADRPAMMSQYRQLTARLERRLRAYQVRLSSSPFQTGKDAKLAGAAGASAANGTDQSDKPVTGTFTISGPHDDAE